MTGETAMRLLLLSVMGLWVATALASHYRNRSSQFLRHVLLWSAIVLGLALGYAYRFELHAISTRLGATFIPGKPEVTSAGRILVYRQENGHFLIETRTNGRALTFLVDTGATLTSLGRLDAEKVGLDLDELAFVKPVLTANGIVYAAPAVIQSFQIGNHELGPVAINVLNDPDKASLNLLGTNIINRFDVTMTDERMGLTLRAP